jgi:hypothetical protein
MIKKYRGYTIEVVREKCLGGWNMLYTTITRDSDGYEAEYLAEDSKDTVRDQIKYMKERIDAEHETDDPWMEKEGLGNIYD